MTKVEKSTEQRAQTSANDRKTGRKENENEFTMNT
jgi:hypothetical protein